MVEYEGLWEVLQLKNVLNLFNFVFNSILELFDHRVPPNPHFLKSEISIKILFCKIYCGKCWSELFSLII